MSKISIAELLPELTAGGFDRRDGTIQFYTRVNALLQSDFILLDFGAGRGLAHTDDAIAYRRQLALLRGKVREVVGVDVDPVVENNPGLDRAVLIDAAGRIPLADNSIDMIISDFTFEHLPDPIQSCGELDRVLKVGGWICARTPNRYGYIALGNRIVGDKLKNRVLQGAQPDRKEEDVFPAFYRLNTLNTIKKFFPADRFDHASYSWDAQPSYHFDRRWVFGLLSKAQSLTPSSLKTTLLIFIRKKA